MDAMFASASESTPSQGQGQGQGLGFCSDRASLHCGSLSLGHGATETPSRRRTQRSAAAAPGLAPAREPEPDSG
eukprot:2261494-Rhodomonas_salina.1